MEEEYKVPESIVEELEVLHEEFVPLATEVKEEVKSQVSVQKLASYVQEQYVGTHTPSITSVTTTEQILQSVQHRYTFLSPNLILNLAIFFFVSHPIAEKAEEYKSKIASFKKSVKLRTLKNELGRFNERLRKSSSSITLKLLVTNAWGEQSIRLVETLLLTLFPIVHPDDLLWYSVCAGSLLLSFIASSHMMLPLIVSCAKKMELLRHLGIISVTIGNVLIRVQQTHDDLFSFKESLIQAIACNNIEAVEFLLKYTRVDVNAATENHLFFNNFFSEHLKHTSKDKTLSFFRVQVDRLKAIRDDLYVTRAPGDVNITNEFLQEMEYHILNTQYLRNRLNNLPNHITDKLNALYESVEELKTSNKIGHLNKFLETVPVPLNYTTQITIILHRVWSQCSVANIEKVIQILFAPTSIDKFYWFRVNESNSELKIKLYHTVNSDIQTFLKGFDHLSAQILGVIELRRNDCIPTVIFRNKSNKDSYTFEKGMHEAQELFLLPLMRFLQQVIEMPCPYTRFMYSERDYNNNLPCVPDTNNPTPLVIACCNSNSKLVQLLLEHGADPNMKTAGLNTALFLSIHNSRIFQILLDYGADAEIVNALDDTILRCASGPVNNLQVVKILIKRGYTLINRKCAVGSTALHWACRHGNLEILNALLEAKADPSIPDDLGATPLWRACFFGHLPVVKKLIEIGQDPNISDKDNATPLWIASSVGRIAIVECLLQARADPHIPDDEGYTALQMSARNGFIRIASILFNHILANCQKDRDKQAWIAKAQRQLSLVPSRQTVTVEFLQQVHTNPSIIKPLEALHGMMIYIHHISGQSLT